MPKRPTQKMSIEMRAKQFMPFAALGGLEEALAKVEEEMEHNGDTHYEKDNSEAVETT